MVFAAERGKQVARQVVTETLTRIYGATVMDSLMDQIGAMDIGNYITSTVSQPISLERPEGTYVFEQFMRNPSGGASGLVTMYNPAGEKIGEVNVAKVMVSDDNRIDYSIAVSVPDKNWTEDAVLSGIKGDPGKAVALVSVDGQDTTASLVDFSGVLACGSAAPGLPLVTSTPLGSSLSSQGGVASDMYPTTTYSGDGGIGSAGGVAIEPCTALAVCVVILVAAILCYCFCWLLF